jgi:hypothetical protein
LTLLLLGEIENIIVFVCGRESCFGSLILHHLTIAIVALKTIPVISSSVLPLILDRNEIVSRERVANDLRVFLLSTRLRLFTCWQAGGRFSLVMCLFRFHVLYLHLSFDPVTELVQLFGPVFFRSGLLLLGAGC